MKKTLIIALCCMALSFVACKKPVEPTPDPQPVDYTTNYVGNYLGTFTLNITSMNNAPQGMSFPVENISMDISKGTEDNTIVATVTVDTETHQTTGVVTEQKADFETVHLVIDKPDQNYCFELDLKMDGTPAEDNAIDIAGTFSGNGKFTFNGIENILYEVSGNLTGNLLRQ